MVKPHPEWGFRDGHEQHPNPSKNPWKGNQGPSGASPRPHYPSGPTPNSSVSLFLLFQPLPHTWSYFHPENKHRYLRSERWEEWEGWELEFWGDRRSNFLLGLGLRPAGVWQGGVLWDFFLLRRRLGRCGLVSVLVGCVRVGNSLQATPQPPNPTQDPQNPNCDPQPPISTPKAPLLMFKTPNLVMQTPAVTPKANLELQNPNCVLQNPKFDPKMPLVTPKCQL